MFAYNPGVADRSGEILGAGSAQAAQINAQAMAQIGQYLASFGEMYGEMYGEQRDKRNALKGMDTTVMAMSDAGAVTPDFRDKYLAADEEVRPYLFQAIASPMFQAYQKKQGYEAYADAMKGVYGSRAGTPGADSDFFDF